jgi:hypothetical protein
MFTTLRRIYFYTLYSKSMAKQQVGSTCLFYIYFKQLLFLSRHLSNSTKSQIPHLHCGDLLNVHRFHQGIRANHILFPLIIITILSSRDSYGFETANWELAGSNFSWAQNHLSCIFFLQKLREAWEKHYRS